VGKSKSKKADKKKRKKAAAPKTPNAPGKASLFELRRGPPHAGVGDLRLVRQHIDNYRAGEQAAFDVLTALGRDASFPALRYAEAIGDPELIDFARRLVAVPPAVHTNLAELRAAAVDAVVNRGKSAPRLAEAEALTARGSFGLFDPKAVEKWLVKGGRPSKDAAELERGTVTVLGLGVGGDVRVEVVTDPPPEARPRLRRRLRVGTGVVAVGVPEASDGPRLGAVRLDPERTGLDDALDAGRVQLFRLHPGIYAVDAYHPAPDRLRVHVHADPAPSAPLEAGSGVPMA
jgi:hypothetical protein